MMTGYSFSIILALAALVYFVVSLIGVDYLWRKIAEARGSKKNLLIVLGVFLTISLALYVQFIIVGVYRQLVEAKPNVQKSD